IVPQDGKIEVTFFNNLGQVALTTTAIATHPAHVVIYDNNLSSLYGLNGLIKSDPEWYRIQFKMPELVPQHKLHAHIYSNFKIACLHAPMAAAFNEMEESEEYIQSIYNSLTGMHQLYKTDAHSLNKTGICEGELIGGNLSLLAHIIGTKSDINIKNKILFIEDIGEYKYNIDRMLMQLKRAGKLEALAGLIVGNFTEMKDTIIPFGKNTDEIIFDAVKEYNYPVCFDFPVGHTQKNYALKIGTVYKLSINNDAVVLE
ncbi:MAG: LD-carboxypeptidase, partial [Parafilimonas sp.]